MDFKTSNSRAYELTKFLFVPPKDIGNVRDFAKLQRFRLALESAIKDFKTTLDDFITWRTDEVKPYQEERKELEQKEKPKSKSDSEWDKHLKAKIVEIDAAFQDHIEDRAKEITTFELEQGPKLISFTVNEEDFNQAKLFFEQKGHEFAYWAVSPNAYCEVATSFGLFDPPLPAHS